MSKALDPSFDFCQFQRFVNNVGGGHGLVSYAGSTPEFIGDRLTQYGFCDWSDLIPHVDEKLDRWETLPCRPGVYAVCALVTKSDPTVFGAEPVGASHLLYIGSAKNIKKRVLSTGHPYQRCVDRLVSERNTVVVYVRVLLTNDYLWAERSLIRTLRPCLNIQHK